jgi:hypothetical protein
MATAATSSENVAMTLREAVPAKTHASLEDRLVWVSVAALMTGGSSSNRRVRRVDAGQNGAPLARFLRGLMAACTMQSNG